MVKAAVAAGAKGIVLAGVGDGNATKDMIDALSEARKQGLVDRAQQPRGLRPGPPQPRGGRRRAGVRGGDGSQPAEGARAAADGVDDDERREGDSAGVRGVPMRGHVEPRTANRQTELSPRTRTQPSDTADDDGDVVVRRRARARRRAAPCRPRPATGAASSRRAMWSSPSESVSPSVQSSTRSPGSNRSCCTSMPRRPSPCPSARVSTWRSGMARQLLRVDQAGVGQRLGGRVIAREL